MATFVLVHGAWRGGWAWERVVKQLREAGHSVYAPSLTGLAERHHLLNAGVNLTTMETVAKFPFLPLLSATDHGFPIRNS